MVREIAATGERVWEVLANGWTYSGWVVGDSRIRAKDLDLSAPGTRILHSIGTWPAVIKDETVVHTCVPGEELVLLAKVRPAATARITLRLKDLPGWRPEIGSARGGWEFGCQATFSCRSTTGARLPTRSVSGERLPDLTGAGTKCFGAARDTSCTGHV